jgi:phenylacetic acid degradation operon negative regulatory protein
MKERNVDIKITAKRLILSLLSSPELKEIDVIYLIEWGKIFNIDPPATRVAIGRLVKQGLIAPVSRGKYTVGPNAEIMAQKASSWQGAEGKITSWSGHWIVAHTADLGRTNKTAVRTRERSLGLNGFSALVAGLWCRPANLKESLQQTKDRLVAMGLEQKTIVMRCDGFPEIEMDALRQLWPIENIEAEYQGATDLMLKSGGNLHKLETNDAARETFLVGESVIKKINADPMLPEEMINADARRKMIHQMKDYNELGRAVWERFHASLRS